MRVSAAGVDPAEAIAVEIKLAHDAQAAADKEFSAEVDKATDRMRKAETNWLGPNSCATIKFEPDSKTLKLKKGKPAPSKPAPKPTRAAHRRTASWTLGAEQNATFSPTSADGNPVSVSYEVTKAKHELFASVMIRATSKAGVAEQEWKQETEAGLTMVSGSFSGEFDDEGEVLKWTGTATFKVIENPVGGTILSLVSGESTITANGHTPEGCTVTGTETVPLFVARPSPSSAKANPSNTTWLSPTAFRGE